MSDNEQTQLEDDPSSDDEHTLGDPATEGAKGEVDPEVADEASQQAR